MHFIYNQGVFPTESSLFTGSNKFYLSHSISHFLTFFKISVHTYLKDLPSSQAVFNSRVWGRKEEVWREEKNSALYPFGLDTITRHMVNSDHSMSCHFQWPHSGSRWLRWKTARHLLCRAELQSPVSVCSHPRHFLATTDLQVSFEALETPEPACHPHFILEIFSL